MSADKNEFYAMVSSLIAEVSEGQQSAAVDQLSGKHLRKDFNFDSLDVIKFIFLLEEKSGVKMPDKDIDALNLLQVDCLVRYIAERKGKA